LKVAIDSNVLIAAAVPEHPDGEASGAALDSLTRPVVTLHALSEVYNTLTKARIYAVSPLQAARLIDQYARQCQVVELGSTQHLAAIQNFASFGGIGARLYDCLIGTAVVAVGASTLVTLNVKHFVPLFPTLTILTPAQYLETL
jgi:predicted nucleic acid-binding protein